MATFVIADDLPSMRQRNRGFLEHGGHVVIAEAANGQEAIDLCRQHRPDAVLLDTQMPILGGLDAARAIAAEGLVGQRIIVASSMAHAARAFVDLGAFFISKPYHRPDFLQQIACALAGEQQQIG